ncbi:MAG: UdgX family uracil-DNA binding protein [Pirellulales bacterium]|nr:UdgX family uracil-DNA binding protein [Pirellulales bacterium]
MATQKTSAADFLPDRINLKSLREAAAQCRGCELYRHATQTVFGAGPRRAGLLMVGEMPGDQEDLQGKPFVGPAGRLLDEAITAAGLDRDDVYLTNAVKHFRWEPRGKRRLHKTPSARQVEACKPWLQAEMLVVKPPIVVCLGATAAKALMGKDFRITQQRGELLVSSWADWTIATHHPSAVLRAPEHQERERLRGELVDDLHLAAQQLFRVTGRPAGEHGSARERRSARHRAGGGSG